MADYARARRNMVDCQVRPSDVTDLRLIDAMLDVPREAFVPAHLKPLAYLDLDLNVAAEGKPPRVLIRPALLAQLIQAAAIRTDDAVLVVGCASGYAAAVVAKLAAKVVADGDASDGPYDAIIVNGASQIGFDALQGLLKDGGRLVAVDASGSSERAIVVTRSGDGFGDRVLCDATAPVLPGLERPAAFVF